MGQNEFDQELPKGNYMKLQNGNNQFRVLKIPGDKPSLVSGFELWMDKKPVRFNVRDENEIPAETRIRGDRDDKGKIKPPQYFWALLVWNYADNKIQVLELKQRGLINSIKELSKNEKWGTPYSYDLIILKEGTGITVKYGILPDPPSALQDHIVIALETLNVDLRELLRGGDPFNPMDNPL